MAALQRPTYTRSMIAEKQDGMSRPHRGRHSWFWASCPRGGATRDVCAPKKAIAIGSCHGEARTTNV